MASRGPILPRPALPVEQVWPGRERAEVRASRAGSPPAGTGRMKTRTRRGPVGAGRRAAAGYAPVALDLRGYAGHSVLLRWRIAGPAGAAAAWWLDDIAVTAGCP